jgi:hypothetical protein
MKSCQAIAAFLCFLGVSIVSSKAIAYEEDDGTQMTIDSIKAHVCANNEAMVGVDAGHNRFLCSNAFALSAQSTWVADTSTQFSVPFVDKFGNLINSVTMHVCPDSMVMVGWNESKNVLFCARTVIPPPPQNETNQVTLGGDGGASETKIAEKNFPLSVHGCSANGGSPVMAGIQADKNLLACINFFAAPPPPK